MTRLTIYPDNQPEQGETITDYSEIASVLGRIDVLLEKWEAEQPLARDASQEEVMKAYDKAIKELNEKYGFKSIDVVGLNPDHPDKAAMRQKFLAEHTHADFEIRFFVEGSGMFYLHVDGKVYATLCEKGDLISVPANTTHWFDMGTAPHFKCIRFFTTDEGWVGNFTGSEIAKDFPDFDTLTSQFVLIKAVLTDIEGTTTSIRFVVDVLFPYARQHMAEFVQHHAEQPEVRALLDEVVKIAGVENKLNAISRQLIQWIDEDKKITPLKTLQGMIWKAGYENGDFKGHVYPDVEPVLRKWHEQGIRLYVFSSGSVEAQKLIFGYSEAGDLTPLFSGYFDTRVGNKREAESYKNIISKINVEPDEILFLSDIEQELDAAKEAGINTLQLVRGGTISSKRHKTVTNFEQINL